MKHAPLVLRALDFHNILYYIALKHDLSSLLLSLSSIYRARKKARQKHSASAKSAFVPVQIEQKSNRRKLGSGQQVRHT